MNKGKPLHDKPLTTRLPEEDAGRKGQNSNSNIVLAPNKMHGAFSKFFYSV
jgi:hypothetical protein